MPALAGGVAQHDQKPLQSLHVGLWARFLFSRTSNPLDPTLRLTLDDLRSVVTTIPDEPILEEKSKLQPKTGKLPLQWPRYHFNQGHGQSNSWIISSDSSSSAMFESVFLLISARSQYPTLFGAGSPSPGKTASWMIFPAASFTDSNPSSFRSRGNEIALSSHSDVLFCPTVQAKGKPFPFKNNSSDSAVRRLERVYGNESDEIQHRQPHH